MRQIREGGTISGESWWQSDRCRAAAVALKTWSGRQCEPRLCAGSQHLIFSVLAAMAAPRPAEPRSDRQVGAALSSCSRAPRWGA